jgi:hypothetical protein
VLFFSVIYGYFVSTKLAPTLAPENGWPCYRMTDMYLQSICRTFTCKTVKKGYSPNNMPRSQWGGLQVQLYSLPSKLYEGKWLTPRPGRFSPSTQWTGRWVGPRASLDGRGEKSLSPTGIRTLNRIVFAKSPYRVHYLNSLYKTTQFVTFIQYLIIDYTSCSRTNERSGNLRKAPLSHSVVSSTNLVLQVNSLWCPVS